MRIISCHRGLLRILDEQEPKGPAARGSAFTTGLAELDELAPHGAFARGAVHEVLSESAGRVPMAFALLLARSSVQPSLGAVVWSDPRREVYPPALAAGGLPLARVILLRPRNAAEEVWALSECLRCRGVSAVVARPPVLSRVQARRLQLSAERGGSVGVFLRQGKKGRTHYAAATRWLVEPAPGDLLAQRWSVRRLHGPGGPIGQCIILEACRGGRELRVFRPLLQMRAGAIA